MRMETRKLLDKSFAGLGLVAIALMAAALILILAPIFWRGSKAFIFKGTIEHRRVMIEQFDRGNAEKFSIEMKKAQAARAPVYQMMSDFEAELKAMKRRDRKPYKAPYRDLKKAIATLLGTAPRSASTCFVAAAIWSNALGSYAGKIA